MSSTVDDLSTVFPMKPIDNAEEKAKRDKVLFPKNIRALLRFSDGYCAGHSTIEIDFSLRGTPNKYPKR